ncbi:MAG: hypothetical protein HFP77_02990 [Methylococcales symbiont of Iophon sp. n. MRB-2018]|nr:MAG: hypothetical protein HFP77_02990 [Methylococcales symbiont of Iophon sp. n. MRB-2018]KAF3979547.1 MAG: hypothetical protein HFP76_06950 [Methylococcales symbiont of Iophon sp. n. MRB-2018]
MLKDLFFKSKTTNKTAQGAAMCWHKLAITIAKNSKINGVNKISESSIELLAHLLFVV